MGDVFVRTETEDFDRWYKFFSDPTGPTREEYGIKTVGVYRDIANPNNVVIHFDVESEAKIKEYVSLPEFKKASSDAGVKNRTFWNAQAQ